MFKIKERKKEYDSKKASSFDCIDEGEYLGEEIHEEGETIPTWKKILKKIMSEGAVLIIVIVACAAAWFLGFKSGGQKEVIETDISTESSTEAVETKTESSEVPETVETESASEEEMETESTEWKQILLNETLYLTWGPGEFSEDAVEYVISFIPEGEGTDEYLIRIYDVSEELNVSMVVTDASGNVLAGSPEAFNYSFGFYVNMTGGEDYNIIIRASQGAGYCTMDVMRMTIPYDFTNEGQITGFANESTFGDYYRFTAETTGMYGFYLNNMDKGVWRKIQILDENGIVLMESLNALENGMGLDVELIKGFQYYILVESCGVEGSYTLTAVKP